MHTLERAVLDRLAGELLGVCASALTRFKANPGHRALTRLRSLPSKAHYAQKMLDDAHKLGAIHEKWQSKTGYFDEDGHPKVIAVAGQAPSYEALCRECGTHRERAHLLELACAFQMCSRVGEDRLTYHSKVTLFTGRPSLMLARAVLNLERFLATCEYNAKPGRKVSESLADRTAQVRLSEEEFRQFATAMRGILHDFVESSDQRLLAAVARDKRYGSARRRSRWCGVTAFVFRNS